MRKLRLLAAAPIALALAASVSWAAAPTDKETDDALAAFRKAYASKEESDRIGAVEQLASVQSKRVVEALAGALARDSVPAVRRAAAKALGAQWSSTAVPALAKGLRLEDNAARDVNSAIVTALGETNSDAAVPILLSLLQPHRQQASRRGAPAGGDTGNAPAADEPPSYTLPALEALAKIASPRAMDGVLDFLGKQGAGGGSRRGRGNNNNNQNRDPLAKEAETVLEAITGTHQNSILAWRKWWTENQPKAKVIAVYRCEQTGEVWEKTTLTPKCPQDGDKNAHCSEPLKTKLEGGGKAPAPSSSDEKKPGRRGGKGGANGGNGGGNGNGGGKDPSE